jgi:4-hydroxyphenylacetate 3-monooxygenase/4-hydroxybutyryl-CoA dehydratase/vinylacetyl-CoA-Delta-isomerase
MIGAVSLIAKYNGIREKSHVKSKLVDLITSAESVYACGITAAVKGEKTATGLYRPATIYSNTGKLIESENTTAMITPVADICGGLLATLPSEADYFSEATHSYMNKYLKGAANMDAEERIKAFCLVADLTVTRHAAGGTVAEVMGAGPPEAQRRAIHDEYDFGRREAVARKLAGIG